MKYPDGVPEENWLPINREDIEIGSIMRLYEPDLERFASWSAPTAEKLQAEADQGVVFGMCRQKS